MTIGIDHVNDYPLIRFDIRFERKFPIRRSLAKMTPITLVNAWPSWIDACRQYILIVGFWIWSRTQTCLTSWKYALIRQYLTGKIVFIGKITCDVIFKKHWHSAFNAYCKNWMQNICTKIYLRSSTVITCFNNKRLYNYSSRFHEILSYFPRKANRTASFGKLKPV